MHTLESELIKIKDYGRNKGLNTDTLRVLLKERLQDYILDMIYNDDKYKNFVFYGGTCLRKIHGLNRLSEDLDFENPNNITLTGFESDLLKYFHVNLDYKQVDVSSMMLKNMARFTVKLPKMHGLGLSEFDSEKIHVKVEINQKPTGIYPTEKTPYSKVKESFMILHYPIDVMMAGKITACLDRIYKKGTTSITVMGRDYYDLLWYMERKIIPYERKLTDVDANYNSLSVFDLLDHKISQISGVDLLLDLELSFEKKTFIREWCKNFHDLYQRYRVFYK